MKNYTLLKIVCKFYLMAIGFFIISFQSNAVAELFYWPVFIDAKNRGGINNWTASYAMMPLEASSTELDQVPCTGTYCRLSTMLQYTSSVGMSSSSGNSNIILTPKTSWRELSRELTQRYGENGVFDANFVTTMSGLTGGQCISGGLIKNSSVDNLVWNEAQLSRYYSLPPGTGRSIIACQSIPDSISYCELLTENIQFTFPTLRINEIAGSMQTNYINVQCSGTGIKFTFQLANAKDTISLSNNMEATVTIDNKNLDAVFKSSSTEFIMPVTVTLSGKPDITGAFNGSSALIMYYP